MLAEKQFLHRQNNRLVCKSFAVEVKLNIEYYAGGGNIDIPIFSLRHPYIRVRQNGLRTFALFLSRSNRLNNFINQRNTNTNLFESITEYVPIFNNVANKHVMR